VTWNSGKILFSHIIEVFVAKDTDEAGVLVRFSIVKGAMRKLLFVLFLAFLSMLTLALLLCQ
jgi:hypothetical protein